MRASSSACAMAASTNIPGWNTLEVIVRGDRATHIVNGVVNMRVSDMKAWDAGQQLGQARSRPHRAAGRERRNLLSQHPHPAAHRGRRPAARAEGHRSVVPGAGEGHAGRDARCGAVRCHRAVRRQESRRVEERERRRSPRAGASSTARWSLLPAPATSRRRPVRRRAAAHRVVRAASCRPTRSTRIAPTAAFSCRTSTKCRCSTTSRTRPT